MMAKAISDKQKIATLEAENRDLKAKLKNNTQKPFNKNGSLLKTLVIIYASGLAGAMLVVGNLVFWTGRTLTDNKKYAAATQPLIENVEIQKAIANRASEAIYSTVDIEQIAQEILPERADFLAPSIASQSKTFVNSQIFKLVSSNKFQSSWQTVNTNAHQRLLNFVTNYEGDGNFNINDLYGIISQRLVENNRMTFLANKTLPASVGNITIVSAPNLPKVHWIVVNLWWIRLVSILLFVILTIAVIWLAKNKRRAITKIGLLYSGLMLATLLALRLTKLTLINRIASEYQAAASAAWDIILKSLIQQTISLAVVFIIIALIAWLKGSSNTAKSIRRSLNDVLNGQIHSAVFKGNENKLTIWLSKNKKILQILILILSFISLLVISLTIQNIVVLSGLIILIFMITEILSARTIAK